MFATYQKFLMVIMVIGCCVGIVAGCHETKTPTAPAPTPTPTPTLTPTPSFTGTFRREYTIEATQGGMITVTDTVTLTQQGSALTGNRTVIGAHDCCTAQYTVPIAGTVIAERSAELTWGYEEGRCVADGCWHGIYTNGGTWIVLLSEDGTNLSFAQGWDYTRIASRKNRATGERGMTRN